MNRYALAAFAAVLVCSGAQADGSKQGYYATATLGANFLGDQDLDVTFDGVDSRGEAKYDAGIGAGAGIGYRFANNWAVEAEFLYRRVELDAVDLQSFGSFSEGDFANTQLSVSALYHFNLFDRDDIETYVGAGVAFIQEVDTDFEAGGVETSFETDDFAFEIQGGVRYSLWDRAFVDGSIRYTTVSDVTLESPSNGANRVTSDYDPLLLAVRFGWRF